MDCIFCKIAKGEIPADKVFEDDRILAFRDIHPLAPVHILIIPKQHYGSVDDWTGEDALLAGQMVVAAGQIARDLKISAGGYKLLFRVGADGGQEVTHIHLHLIGGARLAEGIRPAS